MTHGPLSWRELVERDKQKSEDAQAAIAAMQPAPPQKQEGTDMNQIEKVARMGMNERLMRAFNSESVVEKNLAIRAAFDFIAAMLVDDGWTETAIAAMPVQAEPVAWRYTRADGHFFLAPNRCRAGYPEADGWTETPLYAGPTPPAGGSDAE